MKIRWREGTNKTQLIRCLLSNFYLNMFRASLCLSSGEQDCVLLHVLFCTGCAGCGCVQLGRKLCALCDSVRLTQCTQLTTKLHKTTANHSLHTQCRTPHAVGHGLILLMMVIMMPETCWNKKLDNKLRISCILWVLSLHLIFKHSSLCIVGLFHMCSVYCSLLPVIVCCALPFIGHLAVDSEC